MDCHFENKLKLKSSDRILSTSDFQELQRLVQESDECGLVVQPTELSGYSGRKLVGLLQRLAIHQTKAGNGCYVEVGVFQGLTLLSTAAVIPDTDVYGIDNFAQFDAEKTNQDIIEKRRELNNLNNVCLINEDYEDALERLDQHLGKKSVGVYFVDGPHDYRSQFMCLALATKYLSPSAVIVVDDSNYQHVRQANRDFLATHPEYKLLFESYTPCHPHNVPEKDRGEFENGWWNGINVIVRDPENRLNADYPPTLRRRDFYENEHVVQTLKYGFLAPESVAFFYGILRINPVRALHAIWRMIQKLRSAPESLRGTYRSMNTYSPVDVSNNYNSGLPKQQSASPVEKQSDI